MSTLTDAIRADLTAAMKARDEDVKRTLRSLLAAIQNEAVSGAKHEVGDEDVLRLIAREIKKRRESASIYREAGRTELADAEETEADILARYQPAQLDDADLAAVVDKVVAEVAQETGAPVTMKQMGQVMKVAQAATAGRADGKRISAAVRERLQRA
ncbi:GatB/YqeY domain-containing protein [Corynebacterium sp. CCM 9185]|uniref:GatB/YqeY domain-containing protein n=1 Tax=Corynebacterium marambiense TaxID=2765364 RepID=A0ABS0VS87_9CORY|nr:GatB/YqeY domain-containing protein [Corynebacterium marambiense]MBI8999633.1 GatB/YqeY domain-containing protein [Corynebacterium marambiense]MCK7662471.1 GatB/YqeY domain-containing protein [Corynebacterium marambiense]MCX7541759.1 GatB/YqeY domain-containing protein [Corynebacterium marambiense]